MRISSLAVAVLLTVTVPAYADSWVDVETPAAVAMSDAQARAFRPGVLPGIGGYIDTGMLAFGARLRFGILRDGPGTMNAVDPKTGGLAAAGVALRIHRGGGWLEVVAGPGLTGSDIAPVFEGGMGWSFDLGPVELGPSLRWLHVTAPADPMNTLGSADLALAGIDIVVGRSRPARARVERVVVTPAPAPLPAPVVAVAPAPEPPPTPAPEPAPAPSVADDLADCLQNEGCVPPEIQVEHDRLVLDERVLFDFARTRVRTRGRIVVAAIMKLWSAHPEWVRITIEGHTDSVGTPAFNLALSLKRAERVRDFLIKQGADPARIEAVGFGEEHPRDPGTSEEARQRNRRVEFRIEREAQP